MRGPQTGQQAGKTLLEELKSHLPSVFVIGVTSILAHIGAHKLYDLFVESVPSLNWHGSPESLLYVIPAIAVYGVVGYGCGRLTRFKNLHLWILASAIAAPTVLFSLMFSLLQLQMVVSNGTIPFQPFSGVFLHLHLSSVAALLSGALGVLLSRTHAGYPIHPAIESQTTAPSLESADWLPVDTAASKEQESVFKEKAD
ncbi:MAG: hypothetical protein H7Y22_13515 [Gemmatimonadaceae bacterium]|nr:hypothetical protein [Gloeobacterales cyanobacterium ES-bin-141]